MDFYVLITENESLFDIGLIFENIDNVDFQLDF